jgi:uncharacterized membrane protein YphA (DoxX/SURF4 family)
MVSARRIRQVLVVVVSAVNLVLLYLTRTYFDVSLKPAEALLFFTASMQVGVTLLVAVGVAASVAVPRAKGWDRTLLLAYFMAGVILLVLGLLTGSGAALLAAQGAVVGYSLSAGAMVWSWIAGAHFLEWGMLYTYPVGDDGADTDGESGGSGPDPGAF